MLLELPGTQIFRCIESPGYLRQKVNEASDVLVDWFPQQMKLDEQEAKSMFIGKTLKWFLGGP
ncbi:hypothetical protein F2Q69_00003810 [Brassica cretica]|uniref:PABC domain-containing protein n=1 Tax=Brassica cretica TaxID=69181 RepID=A0A8S9NT11_BRACR|nr:hypothetical protein F2Q69_00003810 [Brassica cretica]